MKVSPLVCAALVSSLLAACGGGGGGSSSTPASPVATTPPPAAPPVAAAPPPGATPGSLVTTVPTVSGTADHQAAYAVLNQARGQCGFGLLAQNTQLETSAQNHSNYIAANFMAHPDAFGHAEVPTYLGFTGAQPVDRNIAVGYGSVGSVEDITQVSGSTSTPQADGAALLLTVGYHLASLVGQGDYDAGIASAVLLALSSTNGNTVIGETAVTIELGSKVTVLQDLGSADVATYPCAGISVKTSPTGIGRESPDPFPARDYSARPLGAPIYLKVRAGQTLAISTFNVVNAAGVAVARAGLFLQASDPNHFLAGNEALFYPDAPLAASTYTVTIAGTNNGAPFTKTFSFTTT